MSDVLPAKVGDLNIAPTTTAAEDLTKAGQRRINLIWEWTQAIIAVLITLSFVLSVFWKMNSIELSVAFTMIVSMYLVRTNHTKQGGIPPETR